MTQVNDYDKYAKQRQDELKKGQKLPHRYVEKPMMSSMLPDLSTKKVLMLGCGTGEESILLEQFGAKSMTGIDLSKESVQIAKQSYPNHDFIAGNMHQLPFEDASMDFVYSSLTIHYSDTPLEVYKEIARVLKPDGQLLFSVGHPIRWASERLEIDGVRTKVLGYSEDETNPRLYSSYHEFKEYDEQFADGEVLRFWIGPPSLHFRLLKEAGFTVQDFKESQAVEECKVEHPYYHQRYSNFPQFTGFLAKKELL